MVLTHVSTPFGGEALAHTDCQLCGMPLSHLATYTIQHCPTESHTVDLPTIELPTIELPTIELPTNAPCTTEPPYIVVSRGVTMHRCIAILGPVIRVSYRDR